MTFLMMIYSNGVPLSANDRVFVTDICQRLQRKYPLLRRRLASLDKEKSGSVSLNDFRRGMEDIGLFLNTKDLKSVFERVDPLRSGRINIDLIPAKLLSQKVSMFQSQAPGKSPYATARATESRTDEQKHLNQVLQTVQDKIHQKNSSFRVLFRKFDKDFDNVITLDEFRDGLSELGLALTDNEFKAITSIADPDKSGDVDYDEFANALQQRDMEDEETMLKPVEIFREESQDYTHLTPKQKRDLFVVRKLLGRLEQKGDSLLKLGRRIDDDRNGFIDTDELTKGLHDLGCNFSQAEIGQLMDVMDPRKVGYIEYTDMHGRLQAIDRLANGGKFGGENIADIPGYVPLAQQTHFGSGFLLQEHVSSATAAPFARTRAAHRSMQEREDDDILGELRSKCYQKNVKTAALFRTFDADKDGVITRDEFAQGLADLGLHYSDLHIDRLMQMAHGSYRTGEDHTLSADEALLDVPSFVALVLEPDLPQVGQSRSDSLHNRVLSQGISPSLTPGERSFNKLADALLLKMSEKSKSIDRLFLGWDTAKRGTISYEQLRAGLESDMNFSMSDDMFEALAHAIDSNARGQVRLHDMLVFAQKRENMADRSFLPPVITPADERGTVLSDEEFYDRQWITKLLDRIEQKGSSMRRFFRQIDVDNSGTLSQKEIMRGMEDLGLSLQEKELQRLNSYLGLAADGSGEVKYADFCKHLDILRVSFAPGLEQSVFAETLAEFGGKNSPQPSSPLQIQVPSQEVQGSNNTDEFLQEDQALRRKLQEKIDLTGIKLFKVLRAFDSEAVGAVSGSQLKNALNLLGFGLSDREVDVLVANSEHDALGRVFYGRLTENLRHLAVDPSKEPSLRERLTAEEQRKMRQPSESYKPQPSEATLYTLREALSRKMKNNREHLVRSALLASDPHGTGYVDKNGLEHALKRISLPAAAQDIHHIMRGRHGKLNIGHFLSALGSTDAFHDFLSISQTRISQPLRRHPDEERLLQLPDRSQRILRMRQSAPLPSTRSSGSSLSSNRHNESIPPNMSWKSTWFE